MPVPRRAGGLTLQHIPPQTGTAFPIRAGQRLRVMDPQGEQVSDLVSFSMEDTVGRHDFLLTPCSPETFSIIYSHQGHHPSCFENLWRNLAQFAVAPDAIPTTFNIFMNVAVDPAGKLDIKPPLSRAGDHVLLRAEMDMYVGLTACSAEMSNNYSFKPIHWEVLPVAEVVAPGM